MTRRELLLEICDNYPEAIDEINNIEGEIYHVYFSLAYGITPSLFVSSTVSGDSFLTRVRLEEAET